MLFIFNAPPPMWFWGEQLLISIPPGGGANIKYGVIHTPTFVLCISELGGNKRPLLRQTNAGD